MFMLQAILWCLCSMSVYSIIFILIGLVFKGNVDYSSIAFFFVKIYPITLIIDTMYSRYYRKKNKFFLGDISTNFFVLMIQSFFYSLVHPFEWIYMFFCVITKKHVIKDDSKFHDAMDLLEVWIEFFTVLFIVYIAFIYFK